MDAADVSPYSDDVDDAEDEIWCLWFCGIPPLIADGTVDNCDDTAKFTGLD